MTDGPLAAALTAAYGQGFYPDTMAQPPAITHGDKATTVLLADQHGDWIVCVHENDTHYGDWHVTGKLPEGTARGCAADYAQEGL